MLAVEIHQMSLIMINAINVINHHNRLKQLFNFTVYRSKFIYDLLVVECADMNELNPPSAQPFHHAIHRNFIYCL